MLALSAELLNQSVTPRVYGLALVAEYKHIAAHHDMRSNVFITCGLGARPPPSIPGPGGLPTGSFDGELRQLEASNHP